MSAEPVRGGGGLLQPAAHGPGHHLQVGHSTAENIYYQFKKYVYRLDLDLYYDPLEPRDLGGDRGAKLGIISAQKCNLCLGDLAR